MNNFDNKVANFEKIYLEAERDTIIYWSLYNFHLALKKNHDRDYPFLYKFSINSCIEDDSVINSELTPDELQSIDQAIDNPSQLSTKPNFDQVVERMFVLVEEINSNMSAEIVMNKINEVIKGEVENTASLGKRLREYFNEKGKEFKHKRIKGATCYNLDFRNNTQSVSQN